MGIDHAFAFPPPLAGEVSEPRSSETEGGSQRSWKSLVECQGGMGQSFHRLSPEGETAPRPSGSQVRRT
jgi:hypothetical protein